MKKKKKSLLVLDLKKDQKYNRHALFPNIVSFDIDLRR